MVKSSTGNASVMWVGEGQYVIYQGALEMRRTVVVMVYVILLHISAHASQDGQVMTARHLTALVHLTVMDVEYAIAQLTHRCVWIVPLAGWGQHVMSPVSMESRCPLIVDGVSVTPVTLARGVTVSVQNMAHVTEQLAYVMLDGGDPNVKYQDVQA